MLASIVRSLTFVRDDKKKMSILAGVALRKHDLLRRGVEGGE